MHYPARHVAALLIHSDFADELKQKLATFRINPIQDFDPCEPKHLGDPKYAELPQHDREHAVFELHCARMEKVLTFIRHTVKISVARYFLDKGWITTETLEALIHARTNPQQNAADIFKDADGDAQMTFDHSDDSQYSQDSQSQSGNQ